MSSLSSQEVLDAIDSIDINTLNRKDLLKLVGITERWATEEETKFHLYKPAPMSTNFHASPVKNRALFGGNRSSKTYTHIIELAAQFTGIEPESIKGTMPPHRQDPTRALRLCMDDYPNNFLKVIWPYILQLVPQTYIKEVVKESGFIRKITNHHGGYLEFMQYSQAVEKFQGVSLDCVAYDEEPPHDIWKENNMRLLDTDGETTFSLTPVSGAMKWIYDEIYGKRGREVEREWDFTLNDKGHIIDAQPVGLRDITFPDGDPNIHVFFANVFDNPVINKQAAMRILSELSKEEMIVRAKGHFMFLAGLVYKEFNDATHLVDDFDDWYAPATKDDYTLFVGIDPHPRIPHRVLFVVVRRDGQKFVVDELISDAPNSELITQIKVKCRGQKPEIIQIDPLAFSADSAGRLCMAYDLMEQGLNDPMPIAATKDKANGIMLTQQTLVPNSRGIPGLYITRNCVGFRHEITHYAWDDWRHDADIKGEKQKPVDKDDHFMECLYRILLLEPRWRSPRDNDDYDAKRMPIRRVAGY